ncbi:thermonuclease family protein [Pseudonocardia spirodelae]|uniref:Thermonuclease family protein n=1 Tax=Pseudonocardia spirodelae TaxID=3133431 RepID=A0ABU8TA79_9PSEU
MFGKVIAAVVAVGSVTAGVGLVTGAASDDAVVTRIVDGDTFEATLDGRSTTIRLLNIDTPETKDPDAAVECLGPEAAARLAAMIPVGSTVDLSYDDERLDRYGRTLAGVHDGQGRLVNAELAREGLGTAVLIGGNDRFHGDVVAAQEEARAAGRGLYATTVPCTVPAQVEHARSTVSGLGLRTSTDPARLDAAAREADDVAAVLAALDTDFLANRPGVAWAVLSGTDRDRLRDTVRSSWTDARTLHSGFGRQAADIRLAAEQAERDRVAREEAARVAAEQAARDAAARDAEQRRLAAAAAPDVTAPAAAAPAAPAPAAGGGCDANYSPCVPQSVSDLDCGDLSGGPFRVVGTDRHRLDADGDGIGCESQG